MKILLVSRKSERCGVADYGKRVFAILKAEGLDIRLKEVDSPDKLTADGADVVIINYHHATLPWITDHHFQGVRTIAIFHEGPLLINPDAIMNTDSTAAECGKWFSSPRPIYEGLNIPRQHNDEYVIGSFGFGFTDKNYMHIIDMVSKEFIHAIVRLHIPYAEFGDNDGAQARRQVSEIQRVVTELNAETLSEIRMEISHEFMDQRRLIEWLAGNDINLFTYAGNHGRGLSSTIDYALSARRPIGVSDSVMFRHLPESIRLSNSSIKDLIKSGTSLLEPVYAQHTNALLLAKYKQVINYVTEKVLTG